MATKIEQVDEIITGLERLKKVIEHPHFDTAAASVMASMMQAGRLPFNPLTATDAVAMTWVSAFNWDLSGAGELIMRDARTQQVRFVFDEAGMHPVKD